METIAVRENIDKIDGHVCNYSDDELIFKELRVKYCSLKTQNLKKHQERLNLSVLNEENESVYKSLLKVKTDCEVYKLRLNKTLYTLKLSTDKQNILSRKKLDELYTKQKAFEEYYKVSPYKLELDELTKGNRSLEQEFENKSDLLRQTKKQHMELKSIITETFKKKVCEFCDIVLRSETSNN